MAPVTKRDQGGTPAQPPAGHAASAADGEADGEVEGEFGRVADGAADAAESLRPIRSLLRGLEALKVLNKQNGVTVTEIAEATRLPRTTAHRVLETLRRGGYAVRDPADERYRPTILVRSLSEGFADESWVREIAKPLMAKLAAEVVWPLALVTLQGTHMLSRETTDHESPLALQRFSAGLLIPILPTASGRTWLAFCPPEERRLLIDMLARSEEPADRPARNRVGLERTLEEIRKAGYALQHWTQARDATIAIPVFAGERLLAIFSMRYIISALTLPQVVERYLPRMQATAAAIAAAYLKAKAVI